MESEDFPCAPRVKHVSNNAKYNSEKPHVLRAYYAYIPRVLAGPLKALSGMGLMIALHALANRRAHCRSGQDSTSFGKR